MFDYRSVSITLLICRFVQLSGTGGIDASNFSLSYPTTPAPVEPTAAILDNRTLNVSKSLASNLSTSSTATKYHATFIGSTTIAMGRTTPYSTTEKLAFKSEDKNRSLDLTIKKKLKEEFRDPFGHAFFFDDDDDDDDDDDEDEWDDGYNKVYDKYDEEEIETEKPDQNTETHSGNEPSEAESESQNEPLQEEYSEPETEAETKPTIVLRTRRKKTKRKRGKKHGIMKKKKHHFKKWKKFMLPLLIAYKLKFFTLVPLLFGILKLILAATSFAGFFFALFAVSLTMKNRQQHHQYPGA